MPVYSLVPGARIELAQPYGRGILSPLCLPVPPSGLAHLILCSSFFVKAQVHGDNLNCKA